MRRISALAVLGSAILTFSSANTFAQKKNQDTSETATDQDYKQLQSIKDMTGKLGSVNSNSITFRLDTPHLVPNPKYKGSSASGSAHHNQLNTIYRQQAQVMRTTNPIQRQ